MSYDEHYELPEVIIYAGSSKHDAAHHGVTTHGKELVN